jgi:hypothetical protein
VREIGTEERQLKIMEETRFRLHRQMMFATLTPRDSSMSAAGPYAHMDRT